MRAQAVEELPAQESPELFGLHANADLTFRTLQVCPALDPIISLACLLRLWRRGAWQLLLDWRAQVNVHT